MVWVCDDIGPTDITQSSGAISRAWRTSFAIRMASSIDSGSGVIQKLSDMSRIADELDTSDLRPDPPQESFISWLEQLSHEEV